MSRRWRSISVICSLREKIGARPSDAMLMSKVHCDETN
jgi:hypothetical protein